MALERHFTPGAGVIYKMVNDAPGRSSPVPEEKRQPRPVSPKPAVNSGQRTDPKKETIPLGTGAHGQEWRNGKLWFAVPPSREVYRVDPKSWVVELKFPTAGNRPHGIADVHAKIAARLGDAHEAEHKMLEALAEALWEAQRGGKPPDESVYLEKLRTLA